MYSKTGCLLAVGIALLANLCGLCQSQLLSVHVSTQDLDLLISETANISLSLWGANSTGYNVSVEGYSSHGGVVDIGSKRVNVSSIGTNLTLKAVAPGHDIVYFNTSQPDISFTDAFVRVTVGRSRSMATLSVVVGWVYFVAWSVSFYPQVYENWKRKSVVGLNFDFLAMNLLGFVLYSLFNCGLYWIPEMESEYSLRHPRGLNPVQLNDIVFSLHASAVTLLTIIQCTIYERGGQRVSNVAKGIISLFFITIAVSAIVSGVKVLHWLDFLYICSYIKLAITLIKYIPQAFMNYRRKSTIGWSIGNVVLDFTGGILSMLQMVVNADNYNDWDSIFGDPTKFGLGLFSVLFDIFFLIQHYILYRNSHYEEIPGSSACLADDERSSPTSSGGGSFQSSREKLKHRVETVDDQTKLGVETVNEPSKLHVETVDDQPKPHVETTDDKVDSQDTKKEGKDTKKEGTGVESSPTSKPVSVNE